MQGWEYRVVSWNDGAYTASLNDYAREGWELVTVVPDIETVPERREGGGGLPVPPLGGRLGAAASTLRNLEGTDGPAPGSITTTLLWVLRRPVEVDVASDDDYA